MKKKSVPAHRAAPAYTTSTTDGPGSYAEQSERSASRRLPNWLHFASPVDLALFGVGLVGQFSLGVVQNIVNIFFAGAMDPDPSKSLVDIAWETFFLLVWTGLGTAFCGMVGTTCIEMARYQQVARWKKAYLKAVLRQEVGWYDVSKPQELAAQMAEAIVHIEKVLGAGCWNSVMTLGMMAGGIVLALVYAWDIGLIALAVALGTLVPASVVLFNEVGERTEKLGAAYAGAGGHATQVFSAVRTVAALGMEPACVAEYDRHLVAAERAGVKSSNTISAAMASFTAAIFYVTAVPMFYVFIVMYRERDSTMFDWEVDDKAWCVADNCNEYSVYDVDFVGAAAAPERRALSSSRRPHTHPPTPLPTHTHHPPHTPPTLSRRFASLTHTTLPSATPRGRSQPKCAPCPGPRAPGTAPIAPPLRCVQARSRRRASTPRAPS